MIYLRLSLRYVLATISIIILSFALFFIIKEVLAWTNPTQAPPGGSGVVTVSGSNVGIGTTSPSYGLDISVASGNGGIARTARGFIVRRVADDLVGQVFISGGDNGNAGFMYMYDASANQNIFLRASGVSYFNGGNVGIGTTSPDPNYKVTTSGGGIKAENSSASQPAGYFSNAGGGPALQLGTGGLKFGDGTTQTTAGGSGVWTTSGANIYNTNSGNVGIGTTGPSSSLHISGGISPQLKVYPTLADVGDVGSIELGVNRLGTVFASAQIKGSYVSQNQGLLQIDVNNGGTMTGRVWITDQGNVGIGTAGPGALLDINPALAVQTLLSARMVGVAGFNVKAISTSGQPYMQYEFNNGNVGIGTTSPDSNYKLTTSGGGIKAENSSASQPAGYFSNAGGGPALQLGTGGLKFGDGTTQTTAAVGGLSGGGTVNYLGKFTGTGTIGNSQIFDNGTSVGIGDTGPTYKLDVNGNLRTTIMYDRDNTGYYVDPASTSQLNVLNTAGTITVGGGSGKITTGTVDPIYSIDGLRYATYLPGMTGQKEETTGVLALSQNELCGRPGSYCAVIDFNKAETGSDVWLFYQITDFGKSWQNLVVLLTPTFDEKVRYKKEPENHRLLIFGNGEGEVSYRFTAPRFDWQKWSNISHEPYDGLTVPYKGR